MAEAQSLHRQEIEKRVVSSNCRSQDRGPIFGFLLAAGVIAVGGYLVLHGKEVSGIVALVTALTAVVVPFIYGRRQQREELEEKRKELASAEDEQWEYSLPPKPQGKEIGAGSAQNRPES
jgi:Flp pilus assembly protein TadB